MRSFKSFLLRPIKLETEYQNTFRWKFYEEWGVKNLGYRSGGTCSIPGTTRKKKVVGLERGPLSLVSTTEELLDRKVAAPV
jgi:hypothetical protein